MALSAARGICANSSFVRYITPISPCVGGASKAGLKKAKDRKMKRKAKKEEAAEISSGGGDLLGDLSAALGRRRKAMSGKDKDTKRDEKKEDHNLGGGSMMDNISRMIPAPPKAVPEGDDSGEESEGADW